MGHPAYIYIFIYNYINLIIRHYVTYMNAFTLVHLSVFEFAYGTYGHPAYIYIYVYIFI